MVAAQMRCAGALRIDHAMALWQLFLVPQGGSPKEGTHLRYPFAEMLTALAEQSQEHRTVIIGEDLGFVPEGFRDTMAAVGILSYRILYFEKAGDAFIGPEDYPPLALACLSTHDLPTLASWWRAEDVALRQAHGLVDPESSAEHRVLRSNERAALIAVLLKTGLLQGETLSDEDELPIEVLVAAHRFIARTPSLLATVRLADMVGPVAPTNLPGTVDAYPNWRLRSPTTLENLPTHPTFLAATQAMARERPRRDQGLLDGLRSSLAPDRGAQV
jgi:4-alpha-glucanotransferase